MTLLTIVLTLFLNSSSAKNVQNPRLDAFLQKAQSRFTAHPNRAELKNHYYTINAGQDKAVLFLPGMGESSVKYYDLFENLGLTNYTLYGWDHIGQGFSSHLLPQELKKVHIDSFETHLVAIKSFLKTLRRQHRQVVVLAHSMGGHLALRALSEEPELIDQLILTAPLIDINSQRVPVYLLNWVLSAFPDSYYPPFYFLFIKKSADGTYVTNSIERQMEFQKTLELFPKIKRQGATIGWIRAAQDSIQKLSSTDFSKIQKPVLILQAELDYLVDNDKQTEVCKKMPQCRLEKIKDSKHEILFELDTARNFAIEKIRGFIRSSSETYKGASL